MHIPLAVLLFLGTLTLWVPAYWPVTAFELGMLALAGVAVWRAVSQPWPFSWPMAPLAFASVWGLLQWLCGRTAYAFATRTAIVHWTTFLAVFLAGFAVFREASVRHWFRTAMVWFGFLLAVTATLQSYTSGGRVFWLFPTEYTEEVMGPILSRNHYAALIEIVLPVALYEALRRERGALLYSAMAAAMYASVIASASRAGTILATVEILAVAALMRLGGRRSGVESVARTTPLLGIAVLAAVFVAVVGPEVVWTRFQAADPLSMRREFFTSSLGMIANHPWMGTGLGTWPTVYPRYAVADFGVFVNQAHSDWLQWAAEGGIPFAAVMVTVFVWCLRPAVRTVWGIGVIAVFLHALVDYPFSRPALGAWSMVMLAMLAARSRTQRTADRGESNPAPPRPKSPG